MRISSPVFACASIALVLSTWTAAGQTTEPGPPFEIQALDGKVLNTARLKGKVVLLDFMTTVCPSCRSASIGLQKLYQELGPKGFLPIGIALNVDAPSALKSYAIQHRLTFSLGTASRADVGGYLRHSPDRPFLVPTLVLLDRRGRVHSVDVGWKGEQRLRAEIVKLLAE